MKALIVVLAFSLSVLTAHAQKNDNATIPAPVKEAMKKMYPDIQVVKWDKENENYEASFKSGMQKQAVLFDAAGNILETEVEIPVTDLPSAARAYIAEHHKGSVIKEAEKITDANGVVTYEAEIKNKELVFDASGKLLKEQHEDHH